MPIKLSNEHFEILGITRSASNEEIKKAYFKQMLKWHPDRFPNDPSMHEEALARSKKINEAFALLRDYKPTGNYTFKSSNPKPRPKATRLNIIRTRVSSSNLHSVGYDSKLHVLQVAFKNGSIYQYYKVPTWVFNALMTAESKGKFFNRNIAAKFPYQAV